MRTDNDKKQSELELLGDQLVAGMNFTGIAGGFAPDKKSMLAKEIAKIHSKETKYINRRISENRKRFIDEVDIIDIKQEKYHNFTVLLEHCKILTINEINKAENIYILSERGYSKLIKILEDDMSWEMHDIIIDEYFTLRERVKNPFSNLSKELQAIFITDHKVQAIEQNVEEVKQGVKLLDSKIENLENTMVIDYGEQETIRQMGNSKVINALGGKNAPAYKIHSKAAFADMWGCYKKIMKVNSYRNTPKSEFKKAQDVIQEWTPNLELKLMIKQSNSQAPDLRLVSDN